MGCVSLEFAGLEAGEDSSGEDEDGEDKIDGSEAKGGSEAGSASSVVVPADPAATADIVVVEARGAAISAHLASLILGVVAICEEVVIAVANNGSRRVNLGSVNQVQ